MTNRRYPSLAGSILILAIAFTPSTLGFSTRHPTFSRISHSTHTSSYYHNTKLQAVKTDEELILSVREEINERGLTADWQACVQILQDTPSLQLQDEEQAEILLAAALEWRGWARVSSALARKYMKPKQPNPEQLQAALTWLTTTDGSLDLMDEVLRGAVQANPTVYLVDPAAAYQQCLESAPQPYNSPQALVELIQEDPTALQYNYNCKDEGCNSECGTCWVSYGIKGGSKATVEF
jgi:hypothetical protein